jgi:helitron helicase-like protein
MHCSGQLFQQYVVDMWASPDQICLSYLCSHQKVLHVTLYSGLEDWVHTNEIADPNELRRRTVLLSSYIEGPCDLYQ